MVISLHSHSGEFCRHGEGSLREIVSTFIEKGFQMIGLSEHVPRYDIQDFYPEEADMTLDDLTSQFEDYLKAARKLQRELSPHSTHDNIKSTIDGNSDMDVSNDTSNGKKRVEILVGCETEHIRPSCLENLTNRYLDQLDYIVGSVHHSQCKPVDFSESIAHASVDTCHYLDMQHTLFTTLKPQVIGHFDLPKLFFEGASDPKKRIIGIDGWDGERVRRNINAGCAYGALFEVNTSAWRKGLSEPYPCRQVMELIKQNGGRITISDDAHKISHIAHAYDTKLLPYIESCGFSDIYGLERTGDGQNVQVVKVGSVQELKELKMFRQDK